MPQARFVGDDWTCNCGNRSHTRGFQPCLRDGRLVEPTPAAWTDGPFYRGMGCGAIVADDAGDGFGRVAGTASGCGSVSDVNGKTLWAPTEPDRSATPVLAPGAY